jgi:ubiquinone/menaquinone biosynthesis C-methylase UbiE
MTSKEGEVLSQDKLEEKDSWVVTQAQADRSYDAYTEESYELVLSHFLHSSGISSGSHILEIGCATGSWSRRISINGMQVVGVDISTKLLQLAADIPGRDVAYVATDGETLPFRDDTFDAVVCVDLLHHFISYEALFHEAVRVVRSGGWIFICDLNGLNPHTFLAQSPSSPVRYDYLNSNESAVIPWQLSRTAEQCGAIGAIHYVFLERRKRRPNSNIAYRLYGFILPQIGGCWKRALAVVLFNLAHFVTQFLPRRARANVVLGVFHVKNDK